MMMTKDADLEKLWRALLSRDATKVQEAFVRLQTREQQAVLEHLERMSVEDGWHPEQRASALAALEALASFQ
jgi:hypothetical protein